jgi:hypothetical protein
MVKSEDDEEPPGKKKEVNPKKPKLGTTSVSQA